MKKIVPVILCGGSGARLRLLSRKSLPGQFVPIIGSKSLLQLTLERVSLLSEGVICVASDRRRFLVAEAMQASKVQGSVLLEPLAPSIAAAMTITALVAKSADHHIPDAAAFALVVKQGIATAQRGAIVTFSISPTFPSTTCGYIRQGGARWNASIFLCSAQTLFSGLGQHAPDILQACHQAMASVAQDRNFVCPQAQAFEVCRSESMDYAIMEHYTPVAVLPLARAWGDVGSWNGVADLITADAQGHCIHGQGFTLHANNTFVHAPHRPVVGLGAQDMLMIDTPDTLLGVASRCVEQVKDVVVRLDAGNISQSARERKVARPWGAYDSVDVGERYQVKRITERPCVKRRLQMHHHRAEHWIVVKGTGLVTKAKQKLGWLPKSQRKKCVPKWSPTTWPKPSDTRS